MAKDIPINRENMIQQKLSIPAKLKDYFLKKANAKVMKKLHRSSKQLYCEAPYCIAEDGKFGEIYKKMLLKNDNIFGFNELPKIDNLWIKKALYIKQFKQCNELISKIVRFDGYILEITGFITLTKKEYNFLTKSGNIERIHFHAVHVDNEDNSRVPLEDLLVHIPQASSIAMGYCHVTPKTTSKLFSIPWTTKFEKFCLEGVDAPIDASLFCNFIQQYSQPNAFIDIKFKDDEENYIQFSLGYTENFDSDIDEGEQQQPPAKKRKLQPMTSIKNKRINRESLVQKWKEITKKKKPIEKKINSKTHGKIVNQIFPFHHSFMEYIIKTANPKIMRKLHQTCQKLYNMKPYYIVENINWKLFGKTLETFDNIIEGSERMKTIQNIWVTNCFILHFQQFQKADMFLSKIVRCDARIINIAAAKISKNDFDVLTNSGKIEIWKSESSLIRENKDPLPLIYVLSHLSNVKQISLGWCIIDKNTFDDLVSFPWKNKWKNLKMQIIPTVPFDIDMFYEFLTKALSPKAKVKFMFGMEPASNTFINKIKKGFKSCLKTWKPNSQKPCIKIFNDIKVFYKDMFKFNDSESETESLSDAAESESESENENESDLELESEEEESD